jgi:nascent polypeptide-associated complex subunit beta
MPGDEETLSIAFGDWTHAPSSGSFRAPPAFCVFRSRSRRGRPSLTSDRIVSPHARVLFLPRRRKHKAVHKAQATDDKRLTNTLKRLGLQQIPGIEEVNVFKEDGTVTHFTNPKVQASIAANTYVVSGPNQTKKLQDLLPGIINQLGADNLANLKKIAQQYGADGDDVPAVENFEAGK